MPLKTDDPTPGASLKASKMPGHWLLARLGKRVLRPGGLELTRRMLHVLAIGPADDVVEFAPGLGITARMTLATNPASYVAIERDEDAARLVRGYLSGPNQRCIQASAEATGLPDACATAVYGEAMLTMQTDSARKRIITEAARLLRPGGRYGIHEMALTPDDIDLDTRENLCRTLTQAINHTVRPMTQGEWTATLASVGLTVVSAEITSMRLLNPRRLVQDEGFAGALKFMLNVARDADARRRVRGMRRAFRQFAENLSAVAIVAEKKP